MTKLKRQRIVYPKRTKEEFDALFFVIRWTMKHGWVKCRKFIEEIEEAETINQASPSKNPNISNS